MGALAPGFRFCPTDEELLIYYLRPKALGKRFRQDTIADVDIYKHEPWDLPAKSALATKDPEWYFFATQDKKYSHTARINRTTTKGYWKATGKDRKVCSGRTAIGLKKTLIYYEGRAPNGVRTNWIMHEYRLNQELENEQMGGSLSVLCRIRKKGGRGPMNGEQYGAPIWNEDDETGEDVKPGRFSISDSMGAVKRGNAEEGGNAFNLQNQIKDLRAAERTDRAKSECSHHGMEVKSARTTAGASDLPESRLCIENTPVREGTVVCETDLQGVFEPILDTSYFRLDPNMPHIGDDPFSCHPPPCMDFQDPGPIYDLDTFSPLPTLTDSDVDNLPEYVLPASNEQEILAQMWFLVKDGQLDAGNDGADNKAVASQPIGKALPENVGHVAGGSFIELDDIEAPLDGLEWDSQGWPNLEGSAAQRVDLQVSPSSWFDGRIKNGFNPTQTFTAQIGTDTCPEDVNIPINKGICSGDLRNANYNDASAGSHSGFTFNPCNPPHGVQSSTRSYLSKHTSTYAVAKVEMVPEQLCYASVTDTYEGSMERKEKTVSLKEKAVRLNKNEKQIDADTLGKMAVHSLESSSLTSLQMDHHTKGNYRHHIKGNNSHEGGAPSASKGSHPHSRSCAEARYLDAEDALIQNFNSKGVTANTTSSKRQRLRASLKGLMGKLKQSAVGAKLAQLEEGVRMKFNDRIFVHGGKSSAAKLLPTECDTNLYDRLKMGVLAMLCNLATVILILTCLYWGYRTAAKHSSCVAV